MPSFASEDSSVSGTGDSGVRGCVGISRHLALKLSGSGVRDCTIECGRREAGFMGAHVAADCSHPATCRIGAKGVTGTGIGRVKVEL